MLTRLAVALFAFAFSLAAQTAGATKLDLSWLAGTWEGDQWGGHNTESWTAPDATGHMFGSYCFRKDGKPVFYELLAIETHGEQPRLLLRHFRPELVAQEEKEAALRFSVEPAGPREVRFRQLNDAKGETTLRYWSPSPDVLHVELVRVRDGKRSVESFSFQRR